MPVILEACLWKRVPWLVALQARPSGGRQLSAGNDAERNQDWTDICEEIAGWLDSDLPVRPPNIPPPPDPAPPDEAPSSQPAAGHTVNPSNASETAAQSSHAAGETVRDLATAAADDPRIERILATFRAEFASASRSIESLTDYKEMHDELHNFEFQCLPRLLAAQPMADESAREELERCIFDLDATINHLRAVEDRAQMTADKTSWINTLAHALELLQTARDENNPKEAWKACILLNRVLNTEPSKINDRMRQIAEQLDLRPLIRVLEHGIPAQNMDSTKASALAEGINSLKLLESAMRELVKEHDTWQRLEADLRLIDNSLTRGLEELHLLWSDIQETMRELLKESEEVWAVQLRNETNRVAEALKSSEPDRDRQVVPRFRLFRRRAGQRFFQVDANLRESFAKLASIGEPLLLLLRTIDQA
jgi:hypothetical protein